MKQNVMVFINSTEDYSETLFNHTNGINFTACSCQSSDVSLEISMTGEICSNYTDTEHEKYIIEVAKWIWRIGITRLVCR